jgi:hypothetical protein
MFFRPAETSTQSSRLGRDRRRQFGDILPKRRKSPIGQRPAIVRNPPTFDPGTVVPS